MRESKYIMLHAPRSALPSESYLQQRYGVSRGTARKAVELLRSEGIVYTVPQRGTYVAEKRARPML